MTQEHEPTEFPTPDRTESEQGMAKPIEPSSEQRRTEPMQPDDKTDVGKNMEAHVTTAPLSQPGLPFDQAQPADTAIKQQPPLTRTQQLKQWQWDSTRVLILLWCAYLFGIWIWCLQIDSPIPASHWMIWCMTAGLLIIWPTLQLSQSRYFVENDADHTMKPIPVASRTWGVFVQWICLSLVNQSVLWPLQVTANWDTMQTMWINAALLSWSLLAGLFIAVGKRSFSSLHRSIALMICIGLMFFEPLLQALMGKSWYMVISPVSTINHLLHKQITAGVTVHITAVALAACVGWGILGVIQAARVEN